MTKIMKNLHRTLLLAVGVIGLSACAVVVPPPEGDPNAPQGGRRCAMMMDKADSGCCCCKGMMGDGAVDPKAPKGGKKCAMKQGDTAPAVKTPAPLLMKPATLP